MQTNAFLHILLTKNEKSSTKRAHPSDNTHDGLRGLFSALKTNRIFPERFLFGNLVYTIFMDRKYPDFLKFKWSKGRRQSKGIRALTKTQNARIGDKGVDFGKGKRR